MERIRRSIGRRRHVEDPFVQILVVVANIQMRTLKAEEEKGST